MSLSTSAESSQAPGNARQRDFALRRLHALTGVVPLGAFVVIHLLSMTSALWGHSAFESVLSSTSPARLAIEGFVIIVPLVFHAALGLGISLRSRSSVRHYPTRGAWAHTLQRVTGPLVLLFVLAHGWQTRARVLTGELRQSDFHGDMAATLSSVGAGGVPWWAIAYLLGIGATTYHLANGVVGFACSFGLVRSTRSVEKLELVCRLSGALLFALGTSTVLYFATGSPSLTGIE